MILTIGMAHPRQLIRDAARATLAGATVAEGRVTSTRVEPLRSSIGLPAISVYTLTESVDADSVTTATRELTREVDLEIVGWIVVPSPDEAAGDPGRIVDDFAEEIEAAMSGNRYLSDTAGECILSGTTVSILQDGDPLIAILTMTYTATYRTELPLADLPAFFVADTTTKIDASSVENAAHDHLIVREDP